MKKTFFILMLPFSILNGVVVDKQTDKVYFSHSSKYDFKKELKELKDILKEINVEYDFIIGTKDYFCRDYMPVQISKKELLQFVFDPPYLKGERKKFITDTKEVYEKNKWLKNFKINYSDIKLDGGNIVKWENKVIISDFIFSQNKGVEKSELIKKLEELFKADVIIIPSYPNEETGHADGIIRFVDSDTVLTIPLKNEPKKWVSKLKKVIKENDFSHIELPYTKDEENTSWAYINYLEVKDNIILPAFDNKKTDEKMIEFFENTFKETKIHTVESSRIKKEDGVLNCFTWNILLDAP